MDPSIHPTHPSQSSTLIKHPTKPTKLLNGCGHPNDRLNHQRVHATGYTLLLELNFSGVLQKTPHLHCASPNSSQRETHNCSFTWPSPSIHLPWQPWTAWNARPPWTLTLTCRFGSMEDNSFTCNGQAALPLTPRSSSAWVVWLAPKHGQRSSQRVWLGTLAMVNEGMVRFLFSCTLHS